MSWFQAGLLPCVQQNATTKHDHHHEGYKLRKVQKYPVIKTIFGYFRKAIFTCDNFLHLKCLICTSKHIPLHSSALFFQKLEIRSRNSLQGSHNTLDQKHHTKGSTLDQQWPNWLCSPLSSFTRQCSARFDDMRGCQLALAPSANFNRLSLRHS